MAKGLYPITTIRVAIESAVLFKNKHSALPTHVQLHSHTLSRWEATCIHKEEADD